MRLFRPRHVVAGFHAEAGPGDVPELSHGGEQWMPPREVIGPHDHDRWEVYCQLDGATRWTAAGRTAPVEAGGAFLAAPGIVHAMAGPAAVRHHFIFAAVDLAACWPAGSQPPRVCRWYADGRSLVAPLRLVLREMRGERPHRALALRAALALLALELARLESGVAVVEALPLDAAVEEARRRIEADPGQAWTLASLARGLGCTPRTLAERFARGLGQPPHRYLLACRIERARELLRATDIPVTRLALDLGFASSQHFARAFRARTGISASAWRAGTSERAHAGASPDTRRQGRR